MPVQKPHLYGSGIFFISMTNYKWLPLIHLANAYALVYKWFDHLKQQGHHILAFVIMPNHLHILIAFHKPDKSFNTIIGNGKRFLAYGIVQQLQEQGGTAILSAFG